MNLKGRQLKEIDTFSYLDSAVIRNGKIQNERIKEASKFYHVAVLEREARRQKKLKTFTLQALVKLMLANRMVSHIIGWEPTVEIYNVIFS